MSGRTRGGIRRAAPARHVARLGLRRPAPTRRCSAPGTLIESKTQGTNLLA